MEYSAVTTQGHVTIELEKLYQVVESLIGSSGALEERLSGVMLDKPPESKNKTEDITSPLVPLAENIRKCRENISQTNEKISDLLKRIQL